MIQLLKYLVVLISVLFSIQPLLAQNSEQDRSIRATTNVQALEREYHCSEQRSGTLGSTQQHNFINCNQNWALRNANEIHAINAQYVIQLRDRVKQSRQSGQPSIDQLRSDHVCGVSETLNQCLDRLERRVLSASVNSRESILSHNQSRVELSINNQTNATNAQVIDENNPAPLQNIAERQFTVFERMQQLRSERGGPMRQCSDNPFVPCTITFSNQSNTRVQPQTSAAVARSADVSIENIVQGRYRMSAVQTSQLPQQRTRDDDGVVEHRQGNEENTALRRAVGVRLNNPNSVFSRSRYQADQNVINNLHQDVRTQENNTRTVHALQESVYWQTFNDVMDQLTASRRNFGRAPADTRYFELPIQTVPRQQNNNEEALTTDGVIRESLLNNN